ncbi:hypothetical protein D3C76_1369200 [compost metagenome]
MADAGNLRHPGQPGQPSANQHDEQDVTGDRYAVVPRRNRVGADHPQLVSPACKPNHQVINQYGGKGEEQTDVQPRAA